MPLQVKMDDGAFSTAMKECRVLEVRDGSAWDWQLILALATRQDYFDKKRIENASTAKFIKRVLGVFKPGSKPAFTATPMTIKAGVSLARALLKSDEGAKLLQSADLISELTDALESFYNNPAHELFSKEGFKAHFPQTCFAFIGALTNSERGIQILTDAQGFKQMYRVCEMFSRQDIVKLLVAKISPRLDSHPRIIFQILATSPMSKIRLRTTQRATELVFKSSSNQSRREGFLIELLVTQLTDPEPAVSSLALSTLADLCDDADVLRIVVELRPALMHLPNGGYNLLLRFVGCRNGFSLLETCGFIVPELDSWKRSRLWDYPRRVEAQLTATFGLIGSTDDRENDFSCTITNPKRVSDRNKRKLRVPPHMYGELCRLPAGVDLLKATGHIPHLVKMLEIAVAKVPDDPRDITRVKAALWALAHIGSSMLGCALLRESVYNSTVSLAEQSTHMSIRGTAIFALNLLALPTKGEARLLHCGWVAKRSKRTSTKTVTPNVSTSLFKMPRCVFDANPRTMIAPTAICAVPRGKSFQEHMTKLVQDAITVVGKGVSVSPTSAAVFRTAIVTCVSSMSNDISAMKVKALLSQLRTARQDIVNTMATYLDVRKSIDCQLVDLTKRRLIGTLFSDLTFLKDLNGPLKRREPQQLDLRSPVSSTLNNPFLNNPAASSANISPGATTANSRRRLSGSFDGIMPSVAERSSAAETGSRKDRANSTPISRRRSIGDGLEEGRTSRANSAPNELSEELAQLASLSAPTSRPGSRPGSPFSAARPARPKRGPNRGMAAVWPIPDPIRDLSADQEEYVADLMADIAEAKRLTLQQVSLARLVSAGSATST